MGYSGPVHVMCFIASPIGGGVVGAFLWGEVWWGFSLRGEFGIRGCLLKKPKLISKC